MINNSFFKVENNIIIIDKDYVRGIPEFRTILERKRVCEGDSDGRKKIVAFNELMYIYIRASRFSYPHKAGMSEKEVEKEAIRTSTLESNYKPDEEVKLAIQRYKEIEELTLPTLNTISTVLRGLRTADKICHGIIDNIEEVMQAQELKKSNETTPNHPHPPDLLPE